MIAIVIGSACKSDIIVNLTFQFIYIFVTRPIVIGHNVVILPCRERKGALV